MMQGLQNKRNTELKINVLKIQVFVGMLLTNSEIVHPDEIFTKEGIMEKIQSKYW